MENYFWNTEEHEEKTIYLLVIYDIVSNKRRSLKQDTHES